MRTVRSPITSGSLPGSRPHTGDPVRCAAVFTATPQRVTTLRKAGSENRMLLKKMRFVSLLCAALAFGLTLAHDLEIPGKRMLSGAEWLAVQNTFYGGYAILGGVAEVLGLISTAVLLFWLARRRTAFVLALLAALSFAGMLAVFAFGNNPINQQVMTWAPA